MGGWFFVPLTGWTQFFVYLQTIFNGGGEQSGIGISAGDVAGKSNTIVLVSRGHYWLLFGHQVE